MTKDEIEIIKLNNKIKHNKDCNSTKLQKKKRELGLQKMMRMPLGKRSIEFIHSAIGNLYDKYTLWLRVEEYYYNVKTNPKRANLVPIENLLQQVHKDTNRADGRGMLPSHLADGVLVRNVYLCDNIELTDLFKKYLPIPEEHVFKGHKLPTFIHKRKDKKQGVVKQFFKQNKHNLTEVIKTVTMAQRKARSLQRRNEEINRIQWRYNEDRLNKLYNRSINSDDAKRMLEEGSKLYAPQRCSLELSERIVDASKNIKLFSTVRHLTAKSAIQSIFDTALFGQRTLRNRYMSFRPASLDQCDIDNGDGNIVFMAPHLIDDQCLQDDTLEISFDVEQLMNDNPNACLFFKQQDLGFPLEKNEEIKLSENESLTFNQTKISKFGKIGHKDFQLFFGETMTSFAQLPNHTLIGYNLEEMHQILCLNFFRYLDTLKMETANGKLVESNEIKEIYEKIDALNSEELIKFLRALTFKMSKTGEFNIYGALRIKFDWIKSIRDCDTGYELKLPVFLANLMVGNHKVFDEAKKNLPEVFNSVRFINYLLSKVDNKEVREILKSHKAQLLTNFNYSDVELKIFNT